MEKGKGEKLVVRREKLEGRRESYEGSSVKLVGRS